MMSSSQANDGKGGSIVAIKSHNDMTLIQSDVALLSRIGSGSDTAVAIAEPGELKAARFDQIIHALLANGKAEWQPKLLEAEKNLKEIGKLEHELWGHSQAHLCRLGPRGLATRAIARLRRQSTRAAAPASVVQAIGSQLSAKAGGAPSVHG